jgi:protein-L-isoaspartate(D-aspartate) O-methyltransferase
VISAPSAPVGAARRTGRRRAGGSLTLLLVGALACADARAPAEWQERPGREGPSQESFAASRERMVARQIDARGVRDPCVLEAMRRVPRHLFVPAALRDDAYADWPLPIGDGQTISQPFIVAYMTEALQLTRQHKVLEVGTGSGYQAAVLGECAGDVFTIEIVGALAARATETLRALGYRNVHVRHGDGYDGWPDQAPFGAIMVTAAPDHVPEPLVKQLAVGGRMIVPVGRGDQQLRLIRKTADGVVEQSTMPVRFVPLTREKR